MKNFFWLLLLALSVQIGAVSCNDDDDDETGTRTERIQGKNWKISAWTSDRELDLYGLGISGTNVLAQTPDCIKDDITIFKANNVMTTDEGATKCNPASPQTVDATWSFNADETILTADGSSFLVKEFSNGKIVLETTYTDLDDEEYQFTITWEN